MLIVLFNLNFRFQFPPLTPSARPLGTMPSARVRDTSCPLRPLIVPNGHAVRLHIRPVPTAQIPNNGKGEYASKGYRSECEQARNATRHIRETVDNKLT